MSLILDEDVREIGPEDESEIARLQIMARDALKRVNHGRIALGALIILTLIGVLLAPSQGIPMNDAVIEGAVMIVIYFGCIFYANKNPGTAFIIALVAYCLVILLSAVIDPVNIIRGILVKGIIIYYLAKAIGSGRELTKINQQLKRYGYNEFR
ncbi:MAG: hypothetical protein GYB31_08885 [Bacteroidetes bacterium]|nr:hypothetical protein [Bacteroidota bacterium]